MKGDFEQAVNNNEISAYLKGEGDYFATNEWSRGYQSYMTNFLGMMGYLKKQEYPHQLLIKYFRLYLSSLEENVLDAWGLFGLSTLFHTTKLRGNCLLNAIGVK